MLLQHTDRESLDTFFRTIKLKNKYNGSSKDQSGKIEQILAYLEIIHATVRRYSHKRELVFIDSCAGNCYLSFLAYYFYAVIKKRKIRIHCVDINEKLMANCARVAKEQGFDGMCFYADDILSYSVSGDVDLVYSLHACDLATDKAIYSGLRNKSRNILSVSCCQHSLKKQLRNPRYRGITRHGIFKERMLYMAADSLRALLLELNGYETDIFEFVSSRYTDKNIMIRAGIGNPDRSDEKRQEYIKISEEFRIKPALENYLKGGIK